MAVKLFNTNGCVFDGVYAHNPAYPIASFEKWDDAIEHAKDFATGRILRNSDPDVFVRNEETGRQELVRGDFDEACRRENDEKRKQKTSLTVFYVPLERMVASN